MRIENEALPASDAAGFGPVGVGPLWFVEGEDALEAVMSS